MCVRVCICNAWISCGEKIKMSTRPTHFHSHLSADLAVVARTASHQPRCPLLCFQTANNFIHLPNPPHPNTASATYSSSTVRPLILSLYHITATGKQPLLLGIRYSNNTGCLGFDLAESKCTFGCLFSERLNFKRSLDGLTVPKRCCLIPSLEGWR